MQKGGGPVSGKKEILSVGIDIGTSTTQVIFSRIAMENTAGYFTIPKVSIVEKEIVYRSEILNVTPHIIYIWKHGFHRRLSIIMDHRVRHGLHRPTQFLYTLILPCDCRR